MHSSSKHESSGKIKEFPCTEETHAVPYHEKKETIQEFLKNFSNQGFATVLTSSNMCSRCFMLLALASLLGISCQVLLFCHQFIWGLVKCEQFWKVTHNSDREPLLLIFSGTFFLSFACPGLGFIVPVLGMRNLQGNSHLRCKERCVLPKSDAGAFRQIASTWQNKQYMW